MKPSIIALVGDAGAGKSTVANYLVAEHGYQLVKFAGPLKAMLRAIGLTDREIEGSLKEQPCDLLCGKTPRHAMVTLGTEWGRDLIGKDFWTHLWSHAALQAILFRRVIVVDDCRFPNELAAVERMGGVAWRVARPRHKGSSIPTHRSEGALADRYDSMPTLFNAGSVLDLHRAACDLLADTTTPKT